MLEHPGTHPWESSWSHCMSAANIAPWSTLTVPSILPGPLSTYSSAVVLCGLARRTMFESGLKLLLWQAGTREQGTLFTRFHAGQVEPVSCPLTWRAPHSNKQTLEVFVLLFHIITGYIGSNNKLITDWLKCWRKLSNPILRFLPKICLKGMRKNHEQLSRDRRSPDHHPGKPTIKF
jgi:hypothetical protein